ncbi:hypothetical protein BDW59DRAFT_167711 [Aspergillus cavernicola]|uniref:CS domain-containing protein n=1 Tax=Aspergillus cavernicola TaxID=176166 RepID=A0ABR4HDE9_9EURO
MLCDDPKCLCHPRREKPFQKLELVLRGSNSEQFCRLDQPGAQLDVIFDLIDNTMILRETVEDPDDREATYTICLTIDTKDMEFLNLKGLPNNSLLLSLRLRSSFCAATGKNKLPYKEKYQRFSPHCFQSKLYNEFYHCDWSQQHLELRLPAERIKGWKTVALILKTFKRISAENWCHIMGIKKPPGVAGLEWMAMESELMLEKEEPSPSRTPDEEKAMHFLIEQKKAKKEARKQALRIKC